MENTDIKTEVVNTSVVTIILNVALSVLKLLVGIFAHSWALISDAIHSASDVVSTIIVIIGIKISQRDSDTDHQYGHDRFECIASIVLSIILLFTGLGIGYKGAHDIFTGDYKSFLMPGKLALGAALISIIVKEWMYQYSKKVALRVHSSSLLADAWHHRTDAMSSVGSFVGVLGARMGFIILDSIACVIICVFILKAAIDIFIDSINQMVDKSCDVETINKIREIAEGCEGVYSVDLLKTRVFGSKYYVDIEIGADGEQPLNSSHQIAENLHGMIESQIPRVKHCMVHVNPYEKKTIE